MHARGNHICLIAPAKDEINCLVNSKYITLFIMIRLNFSNKILCLALFLL